MNIKKITAILLFVFTCLQAIYAQQEAQFTQYMDNLLYYNPAYTGSRGMMQITGAHRQQWAGFNGAPMTENIGLHTPLNYESIGLGVSILNDKAGPLNHTWVNGSMSYTLRFKKGNGRLAFGVNGGIDLINGNFSSLNLQNSNDAEFSQNYTNKIRPNVGGGIYYHSKHWFMGISSPKLLETKPKLGEVRYLDQRHFYGMLGGYFTVNRMLKIRPSALVKLTEGAPFALDGTLAFIIYDKLWFGGNYRLGDSGSGFVQYQFNAQFKIGYAVEISTTPLVQQSYGTHEITVSYDFLFKHRKITSPRYF